MGPARACQDAFRAQAGYGLAVRVDQRRPGVGGEALCAGIGLLKVWQAFEAKRGCGEAGRRLLKITPMVERQATLPGYTVGEEIANAVTHGVGAAIAVAGLTMMVVFAWLWGDGWCLAGAIVFGVSLLLQYVFSALYHAIPHPRAKHVLKVLDHTSIYLLIAGTYTPFTLITLRDAGGMWLFAAIWAIAVAGVAAEAFWVYRPRWVTAAGFIPMGWSIVFLIGPLVERLPRAGIALLVAGGVVYTLGTLFYVAKRVKWMHAVWHLFVMGGSVCHFLAVLLYVLPDGKG